MVRKMSLSPLGINSFFVVLIVGRLYHGSQHLLSLLPRQVARAMFMSWTDICFDTCACRSHVGNVSKSRTRVNGPDGHQPPESEFVFAETTRAPLRLGGGGFRGCYRCRRE